MYEINKVTDGDLELLPDVVDTPLWKEEYEFGTACSSAESKLMNLYRAITKRENYYQLNTPTMYGDPEYSYAVGTVNGFLLGAGYTESVTDDKIMIRKGKRKVLVIDKVKRPESYFAAIADNRHLREMLGI